MRSLAYCNRQRTHTHVHTHTHMKRETVQDSAGPPIVVPYRFQSLDRVQFLVVAVQRELARVAILKAHLLLAHPQPHATQRVNACAHTSSPHHVALTRKAGVMRTPPLDSASALTPTCVGFTVLAGTDALADDVGLGSGCGAPVTRKPFFLGGCCCGGGSTVGAVVVASTRRRPTSAAAARLDDGAPRCGSCARPRAAAQTRAVNSRCRDNGRPCDASSDHAATRGASDRSHYIYTVIASTARPTTPGPVAQSRHHSAAHHVMVVTSAPQAAVAGQSPVCVLAVRVPLAMRTSHRESVASIENDTGGVKRTLGMRSSL